MTLWRDPWALSNAQRLCRSLFEWFNPLYVTDRSNNGSTTVYVDTILQPQLHDIVNRYKPEIVHTQPHHDKSLQALF